MAKARARRNSQKRSHGRLEQLMRRREEYLPYVLAGIISIALIFLFYSNGVIGAVPYGKVHTNQYQKWCLDSDPENNFNKIGTVEYHYSIYTDYCYDGKLYQWYCASPGVKKTRSYECPGSCRAGRCWES